jgi:hypothetical protein
MEVTFYHRRPKPANSCYEDGKYWYIGSTNNLEKRKRGHKSRNLDQPFLKNFVDQNGGFEAWEFEILEVSEHETRVERFMREQYFIDVHKPCLNQFRAYTSEEDRKARHRETRKEYREKNKEYFKKKNKEYREKNRELCAKRDKEYYKNNKEKKAKQRAEKVKCDNCDRTVRRDCIPKHKRTKYCMNFKK